MNTNCAPACWPRVCRSAATCLSFSTPNTILFVIGNSLGTVTAIFMIVTLAGSGTPRDWKLVGIIIGGLVGYECLNLLGDHPFDLGDVVATLIFGAFSAVMYARMLKRYGYSSISDVQTAS